MSTPRSEEVFAITELAEWIFMAISPRELLVSVQRVNKHWHHIIAHNPIIIRHLNLGTDSNGSTEMHSSQPSRCYVDLVLRVFPSHFVNHRRPSCAQPPLLPSVLHPTASWHTMHVAQPPIHKLAIFHCHRGFSTGPDLGFMHQPAHPDWTITYPDGMRMIDLFYRGRGKVPLSTTLLHAKGASLVCGEEDMLYLFGQLCKGERLRPHAWIDDIHLEQEEHWSWDRKKERLWYWANQRRQPDENQAKSLAAEVDACLVFYTGDIAGFANGLHKPEHAKRPWPEEEREIFWKDPMAFMRGGFGGT